MEDRCCFCIHVEGLPQSVTWQHLKDKLRVVLGENPGWTELQASSIVPGAQRAWINVRGGLREAERLYYDLEENGWDRSVPIIPALFEVSLDDKKEKLIHLSSRANALGRRVSTEPEMTWFQSSGAPNFFHADNSQWAASPQYVKDSCGIMINVASGAVSTDRRALHIKNIDQSLTAQAIRNHLSRFGDLVMLDVVNSDTNEVKKTARALYATSREAAQTKKNLHGVRLGTRKLTIEWAKEQPTAMTHAESSVDPHEGPLIVDGSYRSADNGRR